MKAWHFTEPVKLERVDIDEPKASAGKVVIDVRPQVCHLTSVFSKMKAGWPDERDAGRQATKPQVLFPNGKV